jgi:hypothetical protein
MSIHLHMLLHELLSLLLVGELVRRRLGRCRGIRKIVAAMSRREVKRFFSNVGHFSAFVSVRSSLWSKEHFQLINYVRHARFFKYRQNVILNFGKIK